jgi:hypothetical protein
MDPCCDVQERVDQVPLLSRIVSQRVPTIFKGFQGPAVSPRNMKRDIDKVVSQEAV